MSDSIRDASSNTSTPPWRLHLRGVLVALHLVAICLLSSPDVGGTLNRKAWKTATVQHEIGTWAARLDMAPAELEDKAWSLASSWVEIRDTLLVPIRPYARFAGVRQRWRMFAAAERVPARLRVAIEREGQWQTVYESRSPTLRWQAWRFDSERMRVVVSKASWRHRRPLYVGLIEWIADQAAHDFPDATRVRVSYLRAATATPEQVRAGVEPPVQEERVGVRSLEERR